jgi:hypothetical protein
MLSWAYVLALSRRLQRRQQHPCRAGHHPETHPTLQIYARALPPPLLLLLHRDLSLLLLFLFRFLVYL